MIRTEGFIMAISRGADQVARLGRHRCVQRQKVATAPDVVEPHDALDAVARAPCRRPGTGRSPTTVMPNPCARFATASPTRPRPMTPSVLPSSCVPVNLVRSHLPDLRLSLALGTFRASDSSKAIVCSAVEIVFPPGVFITTIPRRRRRRDVDVVDADARPHDRLEPRLAFQDLGRQLRARPDRDAVGLEERLAQRGGILGQLGVNHHLDARLGPEPGQPLFSQLVRHQYTMRRHPIPPRPASKVGQEGNRQ